MATLSVRAVAKGEKLGGQVHSSLGGSGGRPPRKILKILVASDAFWCNLDMKIQSETSARARARRIKLGGGVTQVCKEREWFRLIRETELVPRDCTGLAYRLEQSA